MVFIRLSWTSALKHNLPHLFSRPFMSLVIAFWQILTIFFKGKHKIPSLIKFVITQTANRSYQIKIVVFFFEDLRAQISGKEKKYKVEDTSQYWLSDNIINDYFCTQVGLEPPKFR